MASDSKTVTVTTTHWIVYAYTCHGTVIVPAKCFRFCLHVYSSLKDGVFFKKKFLFCSFVRSCFWYVFNYSDFEFERGRGNTDQRAYTTMKIKRRTHLAFGSPQGEFLASQRERDIYVQRDRKRDRRIERGKTRQMPVICGRVPHTAEWSGVSVIQQ